MSILEENITEGIEGLDCKINLLKQKVKSSVLEDYIMTKIKNYSLITLVQGYPQTGKSTLVWFLMNNISKRYLGEEWKYEKYCAKSISEFSKMMKLYENRLIVYEEASKDITIDKWYNDVNHAFNMIMQTQQYKHNLIFLVFPFSAQISDRQKYFIKLGLEVKEKIIFETEINGYVGATLFRPTIYTRSFWRLDENDLHYLWWTNQGNFVKYTKEDLKESEKYIDWLIVKKEEVLDNIENDIRMSEEREKIKCVVCGRKVGLKRIDRLLYCNMHQPIKVYDENKPITDENMPDWVKNML